LPPFQKKKNLHVFLKQRSGSDLRIASLQEEHDSEASQDPEYCIDAGSVGNIARFINHSCQPNLFILCLLSSHRDIKLAKIMLFAADTIPPLQVNLRDEK
jgi:euchromatic histone-lysine N-methyltransferase